MMTNNEVARRGHYLIPDFTKWPVEAKVVIYNVHREQVYARALAFVDAADEGLTTGRRHYRNRAGVLLLTLDEIVNALLAGELA